MGLERDNQVLRQLLLILLSKDCSPGKFLVQRSVSRKKFSSHLLISESNLGSFLC